MDLAEPIVAVVSLALSALADLVRRRLGSRLPAAVHRALRRAVPFVALLIAAGLSAAWAAVAEDAVTWASLGRGARAAGLAMLGSSAWRGLTGALLPELWEAPVGRDTEPQLPAVPSP